MKKKNFVFGGALILAFILWTAVIKTVDVKPIGPDGSAVGLASLNGFFHSLTGVNFTLYHLTDWLGLVAIFVCLFFGVLGLIQWIKRKSLLKVDFDLVVLGIYYVIIILGYLFFEAYPVNFRPILINGFLEASYPSSTTLLVLGVMPTVVFEARKRLEKMKIITAVTMIFTLFMVIGRLLSGVHWLSDIIGSILFCGGLFDLFKAVASLKESEK